MRNLTLATRAKRGRRVAPPPAPGGDAYPLYPSLDLSTIPFHVGSGGWGAQEVVTAPTAPTVSTSVSVSTWAAFESACLAGARTITVTASISGVGNPISGSSSDLDIIVNPGVVINTPIFGRFGMGDTNSRIRFRGPTLGTYSGGQIHHLRLYALSTDIHIDGIGLTGSGPSKEVGIELHGGLNNQRIAITNCRAHTGNAFYLGNAGNLVVAGCSMFSGADPLPVPPNDEGWNFRCTEGLGPVVFYDNDLRGNRFHNIRVHPSSSAVNSGLAWVSNNLFVDLEQARIFWTGRASVSDAGNWVGSWFLNNTIYAEDEHPVLDPDVEIRNCPYGRVQNNTFYGDFTAGGINTSTVADVVVSGNTFNASAAAPAWTRAGDPTGLDWTP